MSLESVFRAEWPRVVAILVRDFGDLQLAEDATQEAFVEASSRWEDATMPDRPGAWLTTTARRKALDRIRRQTNYDAKLAELEAKSRHAAEVASTGLIDEQLSLVLGCCHPALDLDAQVALTLRIVAGLTTAEIAHAFLVDESTMSKRISRAKSKIRHAHIPFRPVDQSVLSERLAAVHHVIYLIFTEGHTSTSQGELVRGDLCDEATWLSGLLARLVPDDSETHALCALIQLTDLRRATRSDAEGLPVLLEDQDRSLWDPGKLANGLAALGRATDFGPLGLYGLQAMVAGLHSAAPSFAATDWGRIVRVYDHMLCLSGSSIVELNRAVAVSYAQGPRAGLQAMEPIAGELDGYVYLHSARAELLSRLEDVDGAAREFDRAIASATTSAQQDWLTARKTKLSVKD